MTANTSVDRAVTEKTKDTPEINPFKYVRPRKVGGALKGFWKELWEDSDEGIMIAYCDMATAPFPVNISDFPTIKLYPTNKKQYPVEFFGDQSFPMGILRLNWRNQHRGLLAIMLGPLKMIFPFPIIVNQTVHR